MDVLSNVNTNSIMHVSSLESKRDNHIDHRNIVIESLVILLRNDITSYTRNITMENRIMNHSQLINLISKTK